MAEACSTAVILLAAGGSRRMGKPKQLLSIGGKPLLRHVVDAAVCPEATPFVVVLGAAAETVRECLLGAPVHLAFNPGWGEGMASSIRCGLEAARTAAPGIEGVIIALGDQPNFSRQSIGRLLAEQVRTGRGIVVTEYGGVFAPPVFLGAEYFPELAGLRGDAGARAVLKRHPSDLAVIRLGEMADLDTPADYSKFVAEGD